MKKDHITIQCDAKGCGWSAAENVDKAKDWHNAPCPKCGHAPIISDADMEFITGFIALRDAGLAKIGGGRAPKKTHLDARFDTSGLRRK